MKLSPAQRKVLERMTAGEQLVAGSFVGGDGLCYFTSTGESALNRRTIDRLEELKLIRSEYKMGTGSSDYFLTEAGRRAVEA